MGHSGPEGRVPGRGVEDSVRHGGGGRRRRVLLDLQIGRIIIPGVLLDLHLGQLDLLSGLRDGGAEVCRLGGCCYTGYLTDVLGRSEGIPVLGLPKVSSLGVGSPVVSSDRWEGEEGLRGGRCDATERGFVVEEARVWQDAVRKLERRTQMILTHILDASVGPAEVKRPTLAPRTLRSLRHLQNGAKAQKLQT